MRFGASILYISLVLPLFLACDNGKTEKRLAALEKRWADFEAERNRPWEPDPHWSYKWFELGQEYRQTVDNFFYVSKISTTYKENGFQVTGIIGNLTSIPMSVVKVKAAIKKTGSKEVTFGTTDIPILLSGQKTIFSVFVPTSEIKITSVGISVEEYRQ